MSKIDKYYDYYLNIKGDINEHFSTLKKYAEKCDIVYELGTRNIVSTWALLAGRPKKLITIDITFPTTGVSLEEIAEMCDEEGIDFSFLLANSLEIEIEETDLLFIDTIHTYNQLSKELELHANKTKKYIIMHDTEAAKNLFTNSVGVIEGDLGRAIDEFLKENTNWFICEVFTNNNGLTILKRE